MNVGLDQSASALSALERWQEVVSQNITSSQTSGYRKRTINFSAQLAGELQPDSHGGAGRAGSGQSFVFPRVNTGINFINGETLPTGREFDVAIQGPGFFEIKLNDDEKVYTRSGEFRMRTDRVLVTTSGQEVMNTSGDKITLVRGGGKLEIGEDGAVSQGGVPLGRLAVVKFEDESKLQPIAGGYFKAQGLEPEQVDKPEVLQGYLEGSNVAQLREMVDMVLISRAYEANQKIISTVEKTMQKTLEALG